MNEEDLSPEQRAFITELAAFNAESQRPTRKRSPAERVRRRQRAQQLAKRAKDLFLGMKVEVV